MVRKDMASLRTVKTPKVFDTFGVWVKNLTGLDLFGQSIWESAGYASHINHQMLLPLHPNKINRRVRSIRKDCWNVLQNHCPNASPVINKDMACFAGACKYKPALLD